MRRAPTLILLYHRVAAEGRDPFDICVSPARFASHLEELRHSCDLVTIDSVKTTSRDRRTSSTAGDRPRVAITFDDGYSDNLVAALPVAVRFEAPIAVYVTSGMVGRDDGFWWDRLAAMFTSAGARPSSSAAARGGSRRATALDLEIAGHRLLVRRSGPVEEVMTGIHRRLRPLPPSEIDRVLSSLAAQLEAENRAPEDDRPLDLAELNELASDPLVTIGAHTVDHALLRTQSPAVQFDTISTSRHVLGGWLNRPVVHFAYPFGGPDAVSKASVTAARRAGCSSACTTSPGTVHAWSGRLRLPRLRVGNWDADEFAQRLRGWCGR